MCLCLCLCLCPHLSVRSSVLPSVCISSTTNTLTRNINALPDTFDKRQSAGSIIGGARGNDEATKAGQGGRVAAGVASTSLGHAPSSRPAAVPPLLSVPALSGYSFIESGASTHISHTHILQSRAHARSRARARTHTPTYAFTRTPLHLQSTCVCYMWLRALMVCV